MAAKTHNRTIGSLIQIWAFTLLFILAFAYLLFSAFKKYCERFSNAHTEIENYKYPETTLPGKNDASKGFRDFQEYGYDNIDMKRDQSSHAEKTLTALEMKSYQSDSSNL
jgi:hypothetical protein